MSAEDYSVGWGPATGERGHVQIESPQGTGAVTGHIEAALATLTGLAPDDSDLTAVTTWETEVKLAVNLLTDALRQRQTRTVYPRTVRPAPRRDHA